MNIKELIEILEIIRKEHGDDCYVETFTDEITVYEFRGGIIEDINLRE